MNQNRSRRSVRPWYIISLAVLAAAIIVLGITQLGTSSSSAARTSKENVTAANGVVQATVSGSGEVEPGVDDTLNFGTSGTLQTLNVKVGEHVKKGQLIATLDPSSAELTLKEAEADLAAAKENLTEVEDGESTGSESSGDSSDSSVAATTDDVTNDSETVFASYERDATGDTTTTGTTTTGATTTTGTATGTTTATTPVTTTTSTPTVTTPKTTTKTPTRTSTTSKKDKRSATPAKTTSTRTRTTTASKKSTAAVKGTTDKGTTDKDDADTGTTATAETTTTTKPTESEIEQAEIQVDEARATVNTDKKALDHTKLYAPASGMIASLSDTSIGESVSSGSDSSSAASDSSDSSGDDSTGTSDTTSSSGFAELINDSTMTMTVSLSEDDISSVKVGQIATVSITALSGVELAGHVSSISPLGSDSDGVVSYDATITVTQSNPKVLPGMSATASIVTQQAQGVTIPSEAITGSGSSATVELVKSDGSVVTQPVVVGMKGTSRSQIVSGLKAGQQVQITITLPSLGTSGTSTTSTTSATSAFGTGRYPTGGSGFAGARAFFSGGGGAP